MPYCKLRVLAGLIPVVHLLAQSPALGIPPPPEWERVLEGNGVIVESLDRTSDGGFVAAGVTDFTEGFNKGYFVYLARLDAGGGLTWSRTLGTPGRGLAWVYSVHQAHDGGFILAGTIGPTPNDGTGTWKAFLIKTDASGEVVWQRNYIAEGPLEGGQLTGFCVWPTADGGYLVGGTAGVPSGNDYNFLLKTDAGGEPQWWTKLGTGSMAFGYTSARETSDGGFILASNILEAEEVVMAYLVKTDSHGSVLWEKTFGGPADQAAFSLDETHDGGFILAGFDCRLGESAAALLIRTDSAGNLLWERTFGGDGDEMALTVQEARDGGFIVGGWSRSFSSTTAGTQLYLLKTDPAGNRIWEMLSPRSLQASSVKEASDGGYVVAGPTLGGTTSAAYVMKRNQGSIAESYFIRGDANRDGKIDVSDPIAILSWLYRWAPTLACEDAADLNDSGHIDLNDVVMSIAFLFRSGSQPSSPYPDPGVDPTGGDPLDCHF